MADKPGEKRTGNKKRFSRAMRWSLLLLIIGLTFANIYFNFRRAILVRAFPYITAELKKYVTDEMGAQIGWSSAYVDYLGRLVFKDLTLTPEGDAEPVAAVATIIIRVDESRILSYGGNPATVLEKLTIIGLHLKISRDAEGAWNFASMIKTTGKPFDPNKFPLRGRIKFSKCEIEYHDPILPIPPDESLLITNFRGGVDLTDISDARIALLFDISGYTLKNVTLKGKVNMLESKFDSSVAGKFDAGPTVAMFKDMAGGLESDGAIELGIDIAGSYTNDSISPEPSGMLTLLNCSFKHPYLDTPLSDVNGTLQFDLTPGLPNISLKAYTQGLEFKYGDTTGEIAFDSGWLGDFGYTGKVTLSGLKVDSVQMVIPTSLMDKYRFGGSVDGEFTFFGVNKDISVDGMIVPSPILYAEGLPFDSGYARFAYSGGALDLKDIKLATSSGGSVEARGLLDFKGDGGVYIEASIEDIPAEAGSSFYPPLSNYELDGLVSGTFEYYPSGNSQEIKLHITAEDLGTSLGHIDSFNVALRAGPKWIEVDGLSLVAMGGSLGASSTSKTRLAFWVSGIDGEQVVAGLTGSSDVGMGEIHCDGELDFGKGFPDIHADFAVSDPSWRDVRFKSLTGRTVLNTDGIELENLIANGYNGELVEMGGNLPLASDGDVDFTMSVKNFDIGRIFAGREGKPLSDTDISIKFAGPLDDIQLDASLIEIDFNLFGNRVYSCKQRKQSDGGNPNPEPGEISIAGKLSILPDLSGGESGTGAGKYRLSDVKISGAVYSSAFPSGLPDPMDYRHILGGLPQSVQGNGKTAALPIEGTITLDGSFDGPLGDLVGSIGLYASNLKLGLQDVTSLHVVLEAGGPASFAIEGQWLYPSGGSVAIEGPAGWDADTKEGMVDLYLNIKDAPIKEVLALAGIDVSKYAEGLFDGGGRITGPFDDLALKDFVITASEGSRLFGMQLEEGSVAFEFGNGFLDLSKFEIVSRQRTDGGRSRLEGSGRIYMEESGLLPQAQLTATITDYRLESLQSLFDAGFPLGGRVDADISYTEQGSKWNLEYELRLGELKYHGNPLPAINAAFNFDPLGGRMNIEHVVINDGSGGNISLDGSITIGLLSALFDPNQRRDLRYQRIDLNLGADNFDLASFGGFLPPSLDFNGKIKSMDLHIKGKPTAPDINGAFAPDFGNISYAGFNIADAITTKSESGLVWEDGVLKIADDLLITRGVSVLVFNGNLDLRPLNPLVKYDPRYIAPSDNYVSLNLSTPDPVRITGEGYQLDVVPDGITFGIIGNQVESGGSSVTSAELDVNGKLNITNALLDALRVKFPQSTGGKGAPVKYDITIDLGSGCRLRAGNTLEATLQSGQLNLYGTPLAPQLQGKVEISQGRLNFLSRTFNLLPGAEVSFNPLFGINPFLKAEAEAIITQHPKAETGAEPLIITAKIEAFLSDIGQGIKLSSNYPYTTDELLGILGYQNIFLALEQEGISGAVTSGIYLYPSGLISRYVEEQAGFHRFELTFDPHNNVVIDLEKELLKNYFLTYSQTFGEGSNYTWGSKYRFRPRSYVGFRYENLDFQDKQDWFYYVEYVLPFK